MYDRIFHALLYALAAVGIASLVQAAEAATSDAGPPPGKPPGPPPEAIAACQGKAVGVTATFTDRGGRSFTGACTKIGNDLAVAPPAGPAGTASAPR